MQRMQDSSFREVWRLSSLLLKMKRQAPGRDDGEGRREGGNGRDNPTPPFSSRFHPGQGPACADVAPTLRSARADLKVSATAAVTTPVLPPRREMGENLPAAGEIGDIHDGASAEGPSSPSPLKARSWQPAPSTCGERSKKKDGKMKVYPDNSNRINITKDEPLRVLGGQKRFNTEGAERLRGLGVKPLEAQRGRAATRRVGPNSIRPRPGAARPTEVSVNRRPHLLADGRAGRNLSRFVGTGGGKTCHCRKVIYRRRAAGALECGSSSYRLPNVPNTGRCKSRYRLLVIVMQANDCRGLSEKRWLLPPHSKALRAQ